MREALIRDICNNESTSNYIPYPCTYNTGDILITVNIRHAIILPNWGDIIFAMRKFPSIVIDSYYRYRKTAICHIIVDLNFTP